MSDITQPREPSKEAMEAAAAWHRRHLATLQVCVAHNSDGKWSEEGFSSRALADHDALARACDARRDEEVVSVAQMLDAFALSDRRRVAEAVEKERKDPK